jgi:AcrR family transcriptional regulator
MPKAIAQVTLEERPAGGAATRDRLLAASADLIVERGWGAVTTRAVAERADANQALVHYHFGSIGNLRRESVVARLMPAVQGLVDELLDDRPLPESIRRVTRLIDAFDLRTETGVLMAEALLQATRDREVAEAMAGVMGAWGEMLGPRLRAAQERGVIRADIPAERLTSALASFLDGYLIERMAEPDFDADAAAETLNALLAPRGEDTP